MVGRFVLALAAALLVACSASATEGERRVRDAYIAAVKAQSPEAEVTPIDDLGFTLRLADGTNVTAHADNLYQAIGNEPEREAELIARYVRVLFTEALEPEESLKTLVSVLRTESWLKGFEESAGELRGKLVHRPFIGDLREVIAANSEEAFSYPPNDRIAKLVEATPWSVARTNAQAQMGEVTREPVTAGVESLFAASDLASSLLLSDSFCRERESDAVMVDGRGLVIVDDATPEDVAMLRRLIATEANNPNRSQTVLVCRGGRLQQY